MALAHTRSHVSDDVSRRYWEGMDRSMPSKLALMAGFMLLDDGATVVDAGCGSGAAAYYLARLNPKVQVIGVDLDLAAVTACQERHQLPNLNFMQGDVSKPLPVKADAILSSSTLHHVFAFSEPAYQPGAVMTALEAHAASLKDGGILAVRDFVMPDNPDGQVVLHLAEEEMSGEELEDTDAATLLEQFSETARPLDKVLGPGFPLTELEPRPGMRRFRLSRHAASEFLLRKDYRKDWASELAEQYGYFTESRFIGAFKAAGLSDIRAMPIHNHWIINNRWAGKALLTTEDDQELSWPATNILITGRRLTGRSVQVLYRRNLNPAGYLRTSYWRHQATGEVWTVAERPDPAIEILPFVRKDGRLRVLARDGHPRPLATVSDHLHPGRSIEPIAYAGALSPLQALEKAGINATLVSGEPVKLLRYMPSAGGIAEMVESWGIPLKELPAPVADPVKPYGFSRGSVIRSFDAKDILLAGQAGSLDEARLEISTACLLRRQPGAISRIAGNIAEPWTGEVLDLKTVSARIQNGLNVVGSIVPEKRAYESTEAPERPWMMIRKGHFLDLDGAGQPIGEADVEWAEPVSGASATASIARLVRTSNGQIMIALEPRSLPAAQVLMGNSELLCLPAWRMPARPRTMQEAHFCVTELLRMLLRAEPSNLVPLGGPYYSSLGITTERVFPFVIAHEDMKPNKSLVFHDLKQIISRPSDYRDGHLLVSAYRIAQMYGLL